VPILDIEKIVRAWARFEEVYMGEISRQTFQKLLRLLLAPKSRDHFDVPQGRLDRLWLEADKNRNGSLSFPEFLSWYIPAFIPLSGANDGQDCMFSGNDTVAVTQYYSKLASERLSCFYLQLRRGQEQREQEARAAREAARQAARDRAKESRGARFNSV